MEFQSKSTLTDVSIIVISREGHFPLNLYEICLNFSKHEIWVENRFSREQNYLIDTIWKL